MSVSKMKNGKWRAQVYDPILRRMRHAGVYETKAKAQKGERDALSQMDKNGETVGSFGGRWVQDYPRPKESTNMNNAYRIQRFVERHATKRMDDVDRTLAGSWTRSRARDMPALRAMWNDAIREGRATRNPWTNLGIRHSRGRRDLTPGWLVPADIEGLEQASIDVCGAWGPVGAALIRTCAYTGIRAGEAFGLDWDAVDTERQQLHIKQSMCGHTKKLVLPKNGLTRLVAMPASVAEALEGIRGRDQTIVFPSPRGKRLQSPSWSYSWKSIRAAYGRPEMALHELRHYCATQLVEAGLPSWQVAAQLGHTDGGALVESTYGHPDQRIARAAVIDVFDRMRTTQPTMGSADEASVAAD